METMDLLKRAGFLLLLILGGCAGAGPRPGDTSAGESTPGESTPGESTPGQTLVYVCADYEFVVHSREDRASLYLPHSEHQLLRDPDSPDQRYIGEHIYLLLHDNRASLELDSFSYRDCPLDLNRVPWEEARLRGVDFRAVGQEPGWSLEIQHDRHMLFIYDYGKRRFLAPTPDPFMDDSVEDAAVTLYRMTRGQQTMEVELRVEHCQDSMSGALYDNSARVVLDGREYRGCGTALEQPW